MNVREKLAAPWGISSCTVSCTVFVVQKGCKLCGHGDIFHNPKKNPPHLIIRSSGVESWIQLLHSFPWHLQCQVVSNQFGIHRVSSGFTIFRKAFIRPLLHPMDGILDPVASFLSMALAVSSDFEAYFSSYGSIFKRI